MKLLSPVFCSVVVFTGLLSEAFAKEVALSFDDSPMYSTLYFESEDRTNELITKLKKLKIKEVMVFANPCKKIDLGLAAKQLKKYKKAGHLIGNHTCSHPKFDQVGMAEFWNDIEKADNVLAPLMGKQRFFRYPYLNEGSDGMERDRIREKLKSKKYRNGMVSIDDDDALFSTRLNEAKMREKKFDLKKVKALFLKHMMGAVSYYDKLALKTLGRSPKHVMLLHEMDVTVLFLEDLVKALKADGWKIIPISKAYEDPLYKALPRNTFSGNGILPQISFDKDFKKVGYGDSKTLEASLNKILGL